MVGCQLPSDSATSVSEAGGGGKRGQVALTALALGHVTQALPTSQGGRPFPNWRPEAALSFLQGHWGLAWGNPVICLDLQRKAP